jgi:2-polyprenyl-3-methyl-5-hydroxy-6-metoxy-1,4-benzoquinol methylase
MPIPTNREYWNHNTAYHPWLIDIAAQHSGDVLDVGCGDGLLAQRLAPVSHSATGIDPHSAAIQRADGSSRTSMSPCHRPGSTPTIPARAASI